MTDELMKLADSYAQAKGAHVAMIIQGHVFTPEMKTAADNARAALQAALEAKDAEIEALRKERDEFLGYWKLAAAKNRELQAKLDAAQAQDADWFHAECDDPDYSGFYQSEADAITQVNEHGGYVTPLYASPVVQPVDVAHMVNRFLAWKLPREFAPDGGITFHLMRNEGFPLPECWPIGTNLFTADQAKAMFEHCLGGQQP